MDLTAPPPATATATAAAPPTAASTTAPATTAPATSSAPASSATPSSATTASPGQPIVDNQMQSGEALLVEAYMVIWVLVLGYVFLAWRRTRAIEDKMETLEAALQKTRAAAESAAKKG